MDTIFAILVEPNRRRILDFLRSGEHSVGEIVEVLGLSQPAASKHLRILKEAGFVVVQQDAQRRLYRLQPEALRTLDAWLEPYRCLWTDRIDALAQYLDTMPDDD